MKDESDIELAAECKITASEMAVELKSSHIKWSIALLLIPWFFIILLYAAWFSAWHVLGHKPEGGVDDPKSIDSVLMWSYVLAQVFMLLTFPSSLAALLASFYYFGVRKFKLGGTILAGLVLFVYAFRMEYTQDIFGWFLD